MSESGSRSRHSNTSENIWEGNQPKISALVVGRKPATGPETHLQEQVARSIRELSTFLSPVEILLRRITSAMVQVVLDREAVNKSLEDEWLGIERFPDSVDRRVLLLLQSRCDGIVVVAQLNEVVGRTAGVEMRHPVFCSVAC